MTFLKCKNKHVLIAIGLVFIACAIVYWDFITFKKLYVFNDTGSDTFDSYWPFLYDLNLKIKQGEFPFWSHNMGMGINYYATQVFIGDVFTYLYLFVGQGNMVYAFGIMAVLKILLAAIFFYKYVRILKYSLIPSTITTLLYAFNGYIILWGQHYHFVNIMVFAPLVLLGFEKLLKENKFGLFTLSIFLLALNSYYFLYVFSFFLFIYGISRYLLINKFSVKDILTYFSKSVLYYSLGIMAASFLFLPTIYYVLTSPRISGKLHMNIFQLADLQYYVSLIMRAFSNNTMGIANDFHGYINYYESPIIYSSIICFILIPQIFVQGSRKEKIIYLIIYVLLTLMLMLPVVALFFNAFNKIDYRWTFGIIIFNLVVVGHVLQNWVSNKFKLNMKVLLIAFVFVSILGFTAIKLGKQKLGWGIEGINTASNSILISLIFCVLYVFIFSLIQYSKQDKTKYIFASILIFLLFIEVVRVSYVSVNDRLLLDPSYVTQQQGYYDSTEEAVRFIQEEDKDFYRISKSYNSRFLNDALIQKFNGFKEYNSLIQPSTIKFLQNMNVNIGGNYSLIYGLDDRVRLETLLNNKYYITTTESDPYGYELIKKVNELYVYKNNFALPFGYTYDHYLEQTVFDKLDKMQKEEAMFKGFIINNNDQKLNLEQYNKINTKSLPITHEQIVQIIMERSSEEKSEFVSHINESLSGELFIKIDQMNKSGNKGVVQWKSDSEEFSDLKSRQISFENVTESTFISLGFVQNLSSFKLLFLESEIDDKSLNVELLLKPVTYNKSDVDRISAEKFIAESITNNRIKGVIELKTAKMLFFSVPYDKGWIAEINGVKQELYEINNGFIGVSLDEGTHVIELSYIPPMFKFGGIVSFVTIFIIFMIYLRKRIVEKMNVIKKI